MLLIRLMRIDLTGNNEALSFLKDNEVLKSQIMNKLTITTTINGKPENLLTVVQTAKRLKVTRQAVLKMINAGRVRALRLDNIYFIPISDLRKLK